MKDAEQYRIPIYQVNRCCSSAVETPKREDPNTKVPIFEDTKKINLKMKA
ncbi:MAG: hypothetical protein ACLRMZ_00085 [Blautia marasmi]